jgi:2-phospho-L-lactate/phosphoenolpyruvate guanylyltransferase
MLPTALVPARLGPGSKSRLAHVLGAPERAELARRLFDHVVEMITSAGLRVIVLSPHPIDTDVEVWPDATTGLNAAVDKAVQRIAAPVLVVHADLPLVTADDLLELIDTQGDIVIARARDGGTNALLMRKRMSSAFGPRSALAHAARARSLGLTASVVDIERLAIDVDDEAALSLWRSVS